MTKKIVAVRIIFLLLIGSLIAGCGYTLVPRPPEKVHYSIQVKKFSINNFQEGKELVFTNLLIEEILADGRLMINNEEPDLILSGENFRLQHEVISPTGPFAGEYQVRVATWLKLQDAKENKILWEGEMEATDSYLLASGNTSAELRQLKQEAELTAMELLTDKVASKIVGMIF